MSKAVAKPIVETDRLLIRELVESDAEFINQLLNTPSFIKYIGDRGVRTADAARDFIRDRYRRSYDNHGYGLYAVDLRHNLQPIGMCGFVRREMLDGPDLGFAFLPEFEGHGYGSESSRAMMSYGRDVLNFDTVFAITTLENLASIRLLEKLGFSFERVVETPEGERLNLFSIDLRDRT